MLVIVMIFSNFYCDYLLIVEGPTVKALKKFRQLYSIISHLNTNLIVLVFIKSEIFYPHLQFSLFCIKLHRNFSFLVGGGIYSLVGNIYIPPPSTLSPVWMKKGQAGNNNQREHRKLQFSAAFQLVFKSCIFPALKHFTLSPTKESDIRFHSHYISSTLQVSLSTEEKRLLMKIYI